MPLEYKCSLKEYILCFVSLSDICLHGMPFIDNALIKHEYVWDN